MSMQAMVFNNSREQNLVGVMHYSTKNEPTPCLIICHGFAGTKIGGSRRFIEFAKYATQRGISVFRFDFAGSGDSEGDLVDLTLDNELDDLNSAISVVENLEGINKDCIGIVGHCMGAVTAIRSAARNNNIYKTIAWAPFADVQGAVSRLVGHDAYSILAEGEVADFLYNNQLFQCGPDIIKTSSHIDMYQEIADVVTPLMVVHGTEDVTVPIDEVKNLMKYVNKTTDYRFEIIEGAHHSFPYHKKELFRSTIDWFIQTKNGGISNEYKSESTI